MDCVPARLGDCAGIAEAPTAGAGAAPGWPWAGRAGVGFLVLAWVFLTAAVGLPTLRLVRFPLALALVASTTLAAPTRQDCVADPNRPRGSD